MVYIGIDLHRKRSQVAALDGNGELLFNRRVATRPDELFKAILGERRRTQGPPPSRFPYSSGPRRTTAYGA